MPGEIKKRSRRVVAGSSLAGEREGEREGGAVPRTRAMVSPALVTAGRPGFPTPVGTPTIPRRVANETMDSRTSREVEPQAMVLPLALGGGSRQHRAAAVLLMRVRAQPTVGIILNAMMCLSRGRHWINVDRGVGEVLQAV